MHVQTGEIRRWDSLTEEQQRSGEWIKLPSHDENGVAMARPNYERQRSVSDSALASFFEQLDVRRAAKAGFDATGKPYGGVQR